MRAGDTQALAPATEEQAREAAAQDGPGAGEEPDEAMPDAGEGAENEEHGDLMDQPPDSAEPEEAAAEEQQRLRGSAQRRGGASRRAGLQVLPDALCCPF